MSRIDDEKVSAAAGGAFEAALGLVSAVVGHGRLRFLEFSEADSLESSRRLRSLPSSSVLIAFVGANQAHEVAVAIVDGCLR